MVTRDTSKARAFVEYALDTEGMKFEAQRFPDGAWSIMPERGTKYDPACVQNVWIAFCFEWKMWHSQK